MSTKLNHHKVQRYKLWLLFVGSLERNINWFLVNLWTHIAMTHTCLLYLVTYPSIKVIKKPFSWSWLTRRTLSIQLVSTTHKMTPLTNWQTLFGVQCFVDGSWVCCNGWSMCHVIIAQSTFFVLKNKLLCMVAHTSVKSDVVTWAHHASRIVVANHFRIGWDGIHVDKKFPPFGLAIAFGCHPHLDIFVVCNAIFTT